MKKERVDRLHEYLAVVAEKAGATPPAELASRRRRDLCGGRRGTAPGAARVLGRELPPLVEVVGIDAPPPNALAAAMARAALRERRAAEVGAVDEAPVRATRAARGAASAPVRRRQCHHGRRRCRSAAAAADAEAPVATGGGSAADADAAAAAPPPSPGYRVGQRILSEADGGEASGASSAAASSAVRRSSRCPSTATTRTRTSGWMRRARASAPSRASPHNDEGACPGGRAASRPPTPARQIRLEAAAAAAAASSAAAAAAADGRVRRHARDRRAPTPQRVVELEKVNAQLLARIAELEKATRPRSPHWRSAAAIAVPPAAADGEADALRMKVSELQTALKAKEASTSPRRAVRRLGKAEEKAKMRVVSRAQQRAAALLSGCAMARGGGRRSEPASLGCPMTQTPSHRCARAALFTPGRDRGGDAAARRARVDERPRN